jgi:hypothetical protein
MEHAATEEKRAMHTDRIESVKGTEETCSLQADAMPQWQALGVKLNCSTDRPDETIPFQPRRSDAAQRS